LLDFQRLAVDDSDLDNNLFLKELNYGSQTQEKKISSVSRKEFKLEGFTHYLKAFLGGLVKKLMRVQLMDSLGEQTGQRHFIPP
jgi:hypothetical protein